MTSDEPLNTELDSGPSDIPAFSAGHIKHEWTSWACMEVLFPFLEEKYQNWLTTKQDESTEAAKQTAADETTESDDKDEQENGAKKAKIDEGEEKENLEGDEDKEKEEEEETAKKDTEHDDL